MYPFSLLQVKVVQGLFSKQLSWSGSPVPVLLFSTPQPSVDSAGGPSRGLVVGGVLVTDAGARATSEFWAAGAGDETLELEIRGVSGTKLEKSLVDGRGLLAGAASSHESFAGGGLVSAASPPAAEDAWLIERPST